MKISRDWLQTFFDTPLPDATELSHALTFHAFEIDGIERHQDDDVLDVKVTPNRGHDCLSYRGIAKEVSAILEMPIIEEKGFAKPVLLEPKTDTVSVVIDDTALCPRYIAGHIKGVKVGPSPEWLQKRLRAMGQQSINNIVDATNFVMFETGQPLHAFDGNKLETLNGKRKIIVRKAKAGETMIALDEKGYTFTDSMLLIVDGKAEVPVGIAGVKGGMPSGINDDTTDIVIESANFNGVSIRKTAHALKLRTDASQRFEQGISPELAAYVMKEAVELIQKLAGGDVVGFVDEYTLPQQERTVSVTLPHINKLLGTSIGLEIVEDVFRRLAFVFAKNGDTFTVTVPFERLDIIIPEDLIEEVGRMVGYDSVKEEEMPPLSRSAEITQSFAAAERVRRDLTEQGYSEIFTSVFTEKGKRAVSNKIGGDKPFLRANLTDGLSDALKKNIQSKDLLGLKEVRLFEIGTVWLKDKEVIMVGTVTEKQKASEKPLTEVVTEQFSEYETLPISETHRFQQFSRYPYIVRDVALWCPKGTAAEVILEDIRKHAGAFLVRSELFDTFEKGDKVSYAFRLVFQSFDQTLTDLDANERMESVYTSLRAQGFEIR